MIIFYQIIALVFAVVLSTLGSTLVVRGSIAIFKKFGWSHDFIALTVIGLCFKLPELLIIYSGTVRQIYGQEVSQLMVGNVVGSNMGQVSLALGMAGLLHTLKVNKKETLNNGLILIGSTFLFLIFALDGQLSRTDGAIHLFFYVAYLVFTNFKRANKKKIKLSTRLKKIFQKKNLFNLLLLFFGLGTIIFSSNLVVQSSLELAHQLHINQLMIGLFVVGLAVSLPELMAAFKIFKREKTSQKGLSVAEMLGGNIIVILLGLGLTSIIRPWTISRNIAKFDLPYLLLATVVTVLFLLTKKKFDRKESFLVLALYGIFIVLKSLGF